MDATNALYNEGENCAISEDAPCAEYAAQVMEMRTIDSLLKKQTTDVTNLYQAVKLVSKY